MYRIDNATAITPIPAPAAAGPNPDYFFTKGNPGLAIPATIVDDDWLNAIQEELCNVIGAAGISLSKTVRTQLRDSILKMTRDGGSNYAADSGGANTLAIALSPAPTAYTAGMKVVTKVNTDNTGASTINVNGLGAKNIKTLFGLDPSAKQLKSGKMYTLVYDGTQFIMESATERVISYTGNGPALTSFGVYQLGGGLILQWGIFGGGGTGGTPASFPTAFNTLHALWCTPYQSPPGVAGATIIANAYPVSNTTYEANSSNVAFAAIWFAIGI